MIKPLIQLANELDSRGLFAEADTVDCLLKEAYMGGQYSGRGPESIEEITFEQIDNTRMVLSLLDPTGALSIPDIPPAITAFKEDNSILNGVLLILAVAAVIPIAGKLAKLGSKTLKMLMQTLIKTKSVVPPAFQRKADDIILKTKEAVEEAGEEVAEEAVEEAGEEVGGRSMQTQNHAQKMASKRRHLAILKKNFENEETLLKLYSEMTSVQALEHALKLNKSRGAPDSHIMQIKQTIKRIRDEGEEVAAINNKSKEVLAGMSLRLQKITNDEAADIKHSEALMKITEKLVRGGFLPAVQTGNLQRADYFNRSLTYVNRMVQEGDWDGILTYADNLDNIG